MGEMRSNIAHFARDALWLHGLFQQLPPELEQAEMVVTKLGATECNENAACSKTAGDRELTAPLSVQIL